MDKTSLLHKQMRDSELKRTNAQLAANGEPPITMPSVTSSVNLAAQINSTAVYKDDTVDVVEDGEHPFGNNSNNLRVARRVAASTEQAAQPSSVLTPKQAAQQALDKAANFDSIDEGDDAEYTADQLTASNVNRVLPALAKAPVPTPVGDGTSQPPETPGPDTAGNTPPPLPSVPPTFKG